MTNNNKIKYDFLNNKKWLYKEYVLKKQTISLIALKCNCSWPTVKRFIKKHNIKLRVRITKPKIKYELLKDKGYLFKEYILNKRKIKDIGNECNCSGETVRKYLKIHNIEIYKGSRKANKTLLDDKDFLTNEYNIKGKTLKEIGKLCNCSETIVRTYFFKHNIKIKNTAHLKYNNIKWDLLEDRVFLYNEYVKKENPAYEIAEKCNCSRETIYKYLNINNIEIRNTGFYVTGEKNYNWNGGSSFKPYCHKFNTDTKEKVRNIFGRKCFLCGKPEKENPTKLHVHHVDYNKGQGCGHSWSLVPLCLSCHTKTNHNRYYWFNLLNNYWLLNSEINFYNIILFIKGDIDEK